MNIEGFDRFTTDWHDVWNGGSRKAELRVNGGYVKLALDFGREHAHVHQLIRQDARPL